MDVKLMTYIKRHNSDAVPPESAVWTTYDCVLKMPTSMNSPVIRLNLSSKPAGNYAYIPDWDMYYFVSDITFVNNNIFELHLDVDAMATARPYILTTSAFVKYSSSNFNEYLKDDRIQPTAEITSVVSNNDFSAHFNSQPELTSSYSLLLTVLNGQPTGDGNYAGIKHYLINATNLRYICENLCANGEHIVDGVKQIFADAKDSLIKLQLVPWSLTGLQQMNIIGTTPVDLYLGSYNTGQTGYIMDANAVYDTQDFVSIPTRHSGFAMIEPFCEAKIHIPLIGTFDLSLAELQDSTKVYFRYFCNIASGKATCIIWKGNANITNSDVKILGCYDGNVNADVPLGVIQSQNPTGLLTGGASLVGGLLAGGALTVGGIAGAVASFGSYFQKQVSVINAFGGNASAKDNLKFSIYLVRRMLSEDPANLTALYGRPCAKVLQMNTLSGYVQTSQFNLMGPFDEYITEKVNSIMDSGAYLE